MQQEEERRNFIMGHILFNSRYNFYEINMSRSQNMMRLYDHEGNLRMVRHIDLPEDCNQVYSCGQFLIILQNSKRKLYVMDLTSPGFSVISCENNQINRINLCVYNESANLFFLLDDQRKVYYLMCTLTTIQIKLLLECNQFIEIDKMYISSEEIFQTSQNFSSTSQFKDMDDTFNVYLFSQREKKLITYQVDSSDDKLKSMKIKENIYDVYCENNWVLVAEEKKQIYEDSERQSEISIKNNKQISLMIKGQGQYMNNFLQSDFPIKIASTPSSLLIFGADYHMVAFIHQKEWESFKIGKSIIIPEIKQLLKKENEFLFKINKLGLEKFELQLWVFDGIGSKFKSYSKRLSKHENLYENRPSFGSPLRNQMQQVMQIQENGNLSKERDAQNPLIKIHNNIKTIFSLSGEINPAFENQVILYLQSVHSRRNSDKQLILQKKQIGLMLFYTLLKQNPMTLLKLSSSMISHSVWKKSEISPQRQEEVYQKFLQWVYKVIDELCLQVRLTLPDYFEEQDKQSIKDKQSLEDEEFYKHLRDDMQDQLQRWLKMMRNLIKFISIHKHAVDQNSLSMNRGLENRRKASRIDSQLEKAKSIYLTIQTLKKLENFKVKGITNQKWFHTMKKIQQNSAFTSQQFDQNSPELFNLFEGEKYTPISIKKIISFMINSQVYIQTAFAYLCLFPPSEKLDELPSIAYLNHQSHLKMLSVLYNCQPHFQPQKIEKIVHSKLDQAASFVMLLPFPENKPFIKQIFKLSIHYEEYVTAKQIFKSGFCLFWMKYLNNELSRDKESTTTKKEYMNDLRFIIDCYCKCTKIVEGYQFLKQVEKQFKQKTLSQTERESILDKFINTAIKQDKLVLLLKTLAKDKDDHKTIKEQLTRKVSSNTLAGLQNILSQK